MSLAQSIKNRNKIPHPCLWLHVFDLPWSLPTNQKQSTLWALGTSVVKNTKAYITVFINQSAQCGTEGKYQRVHRVFVTSKFSGSSVVTLLSRVFIFSLFFHQTFLRMNQIFFRLKLTSCSTSERLLPVKHQMNRPQLRPS